jgi:hypothetical protein
VTGNRPGEGDAVVVRLDDYRRRQPPPLAAYCVTLGVAGTAVATALSCTVTGIAACVVWAAVIATFCVAAGLAYDSALLAAGWAACRRAAGGTPRGGVVPK